MHLLDIRFNQNRNHELLPLIEQAATSLLETFLCTKPSSPERWPEADIKVTPPARSWTG